MFQKHFSKTCLASSSNEGQEEALHMHFKPVWAQRYSTQSTLHLGLQEHITLCQLLSIFLKQIPLHYFTADIRNLNSGSNSPERPNITQWSI